MRLAATRGLEAVSLRHVAAEAGSLPGMVQHYFRTKDEMMGFALEMVMDRIEERSRAALTPGSPREIVRALLLQILPLDETRRLEGHVGLAFLAYAAVKPAMAVGLREAADGMRGCLADQVRAAAGPGVHRRPRARGCRARRRMDAAAVRGSSARRTRWPPWTPNSTWSSGSPEPGSAFVTLERPRPGGDRRGPVHTCA
ncbi:hypothetical protein SGRIM128S_03563 [Streptomyces griseomycini]